MLRSASRYNPFYRLIAFSYLSCVDGLEVRNNLDWSGLARCQCDLRLQGLLPSLFPNDGSHKLITLASRRIDYLNDLTLRYVAGTGISGSCFLLNTPLAVRLWIF